MPNLHRTDVALLADPTVFVTYILSEANVVDVDPLHVAEQFQVARQRAPWTARELGQ